MFSTQEREFLRLCTQAAPDWGMLRQLTYSINYDILRSIALANQLDGVVAWRLLSAQLGASVPSAVKDISKADLCYLETQNISYWQQATTVQETLDILGIPYVVVGGPAQYAPLGMNAYPRLWTDIDIFIGVDQLAQQQVFCDLLDPIEVVRWRPSYWDIQLPGGIRLGLNNYLRPEGHGGPIWEVLRAPQIVEVMGHQLPIPDSALWLAYMAERTWDAVCGRGKKLTLWALARLALWWPHADQQALRKLLRERTIGNDWPRPTHWKAVNKMRGHTAAYRALWFLAMTDRVYNVFHCPAEDLVSPFARLDPPIICAEAAIYDPASTWLYYLCEWVNRDDEERIFEMPEGLDNRLLSGYWQKLNVLPFSVSLGDSGDPETLQVGKAK